MGAWLQLASPLTAEIMASAGFDWLMIDMEHAPGDILTLVSQVQAISSTDTVPFARAPWNDAVIIKRILDTGVAGVLIPSVNTPGEAEKAVSACKYPPQGNRGVAGSHRAAGFGQEAVSYLESANDETLVITAIETPMAADNLVDILSVQELDGIFIGPMDLASSMGHLGNPGHPEVQALISRIEERVLDAGKILGTTTTPEHAKEKYDRGYQMLMLMSDSVSLASLARKTISDFERYTGN